MMGVTLTAAGALQWFHNEVVTAGEPSKSMYKQITQEAQKVPAGSEGLQFLPYLAGERTPHLDPHARGALVGITLKHTRGHITRAIMEGVTMALRDSYAIMQDLGVPVRQVRASGGGSKNPFWRQMQADVFGKPVTAMVADEGAAYGAALLATVGAGLFKNIEEACQATIKTADQTKPNAKARNAYNKAFPVFQSLYGALRDEFPKLGG
jgi:xylulokinase